MDTHLDWAVSGFAADQFAAGSDQDGAALIPGMLLLLFTAPFGLVLPSLAAMAGPGAFGDPPAGWLVVGATFMFCALVNAALVLFPLYLTSRPAPTPDPPPSPNDGWTRPDPDSEMAPL